MSPHEQEELEQGLRAVFEPDEASVERVVSAAMLSGSKRRWMPGMTIAFAGVVVVVALVLWLRPTSVRAESVQLEYSGNVALLEYSDGTSWVISTDSEGKGPQIPINLIFVEGDKP